LRRLDFTHLKALLMRQGQQNKRMRGRNRKGPNPLTRSFESNGGDVKLRGTALHIAEKYVQLARDAQSSGDRVAAENYFQHAEHYYRIVAAAQSQMPQPQPIIRNDDGDEEDDGEFRVNGVQPGGDRQPGQGNGQPQFGAADQPFVNGAPDAEDDRDNYGERDQGNYRQGLDATLNRHGGQGGYGNQGQGGGGYGGQSGPGGNNSQGGHGGQGGRDQGNQGQFRRRRPFRERYGDRDRDRDRNSAGNTGGAAPQGERVERAEPPETSDSSED
jgi:hypothetical protein